MIDAVAPAEPDSASVRQLDPRWIVAERISGAIGAAVISAGGLIAALLLGRHVPLFSLGAWVVVAAGLFAAAMVAPALQYRRASYAVSPLGIEIRRGVLWRRVTIVPRSRIQHTDVEQGPLLRRFGLAKLVIHTAGTEHATVPLYGLAMADAVAIRDGLIGVRAAAPGPDAQGPAPRNGGAAQGDAQDEADGI